MNPTSPLIRRALSAALVAVVVSGAGCSWWRGKSGYENSPESRPLEIPPDLDRPASDSSMQIPAVSSPRVAAAAAPATGGSFVIADSTDGAWRRVGLALERIEGVTIGARAQPAYEVTFEGESFAITLAADGEGTRISAVGADGQEVRTGAAGKLLAQLRQRLG